eukprot:3302340-Amphidinium_carterae.1
MLCSSQQKRLRHCYAKLVRRTAKLEVDFGGNFLRVADAVIFGQLELPDFEITVHKLRLKEFRRLVTANSDIVRAAAAFSLGETSVLYAHMASIRWMQSQTSVFRHLAPCSACTLGDWITVAVSQWSAWSSAIKAAVACGVEELKEQARTHYRLAQEVELVVVEQAATPEGVPDVPLPPEQDGLRFSDAGACFACENCGKAFQTRRGRDAHARNSHGQLPAHTLLIRQRQCPSCDSVYNTRGQAVTHLKSRRVCLEYATMHVTPLTLDEYKEEMEAERKRPKCETRLVAPRVGPQYVNADGKPMARQVRTADPNVVFAGLAADSTACLVHRCPQRFMEGAAVTFEFLAFLCLVFAACAPALHLYVYMVRAHISVTYSVLAHSEGALACNTCMQFSCAPAALLPRAARQCHGLKGQKGQFLIF